MPEKPFLNVEDIMGIMEIAKSTAYQLIRQLNKELKDRGYITMQGRISTQYFYERCGIITEEQLVDGQTTA